MISISVRMFETLHHVPSDPCYIVLLDCFLHVVFNIKELKTSSPKYMTVPFMNHPKMVYMKGNLKLKVQSRSSNSYSYTGTVNSLMLTGI